ncbi:MAG: crotonase/enoyl-CoA hydratase family protein [Actinophytocola sp.]|nr:crotonase/enoyl-CoA hydratase family protein [Actinophytocola sp.]
MADTLARLRTAVTVARSLVSSLATRRQAPSGDHSVPDSIAAHDHTLTASVEIAAPPVDVFALATDFTRYDEWLTVHGGWRDRAPARPEPSASFVQKCKIMGMPIDVRWRVTGLTDTSIELAGTGPMGALVGLSYAVEPSAKGSKVWVDCGLGGDPLKGPMGTSAARSFSSELDTSLRRLAGLLGGTTQAETAAPEEVEPLSVLRPAGDPARHHSGALLDPRTPVIVGVGQVVHRPSPDGELPDPATLAVKALRRAAEDSSAGERLLAKADSVRSVSSASWAYNDKARLVADAVGASPRETVASARFGGDGAQRLFNDSAQSIAGGLADVVLISGAESGASIVEAQRRGTSPDWPEQPSDVAPRRVIGTEREANNDAETAAGLMAPIYVYALLENAVRARLGTTPEAHLHDIAELWSRFSTVAARNPYAWQPQSFTAAELASTSDANRPVSSPYPKLLTANLKVDLASGVIMCSAAAAQEAGIPSERWVFPHAGAHAQDEWFVSERAELAASPAINAIGRAALDHAGLSIADVQHIDLYSCFPSAVQIAAGELGLPIDRPLTVTGGLTFAGGPGNNYTGHSLATMVGILRKNPDDYGMTTGLGWYVTKHAIGVYSAKPPRQTFRQIDAGPLMTSPPSRPVATQYTGPAVVESYTVPYTRDGEPEAVIISALTSDGSRVLVRSKDPEVVDVMAESDPLGWTIDVESTDACRVVDRMPAPLPEPPPPPVQVERTDGVHVITLNRPRTRNAINLAAARALERALDEFEADDDARVAVLTGAGGTFCAGMDLKAAAKGEYPLTEGRGPLGMTQRPPSKPVIAAVEGYAHAGGFELALASDLIVAAEDAEFGIPEPKRGLVAAAGGLLRLSERLPRNSALELALTAEPLPARRLYELGVVNRLVARGTAKEVALELAATIAANAPLAVEASKRIIDERAGWSGAEAWDKQTDVASVALFSEDATEGVRAFAQGRDPVWRGR